MNSLTIDLNLVDQLPDGVLVLDAERRISAVSAVMARMTGRRDAAGGCAGGLHLECTAAAVRECDGAGTATDPDHYHSLCDSRLNLLQGVAATAHWRAVGAEGATP